MDKKRGVAQFLLEHAAGEPVSFHMPGHKGGRLYREYGYEEFLERVMDCDVTEFPGADNLFQPEGVIRETMNRYKAIYGAKESFLLVGGSSAGLIAAIMTCVPAGGKLIMARNCHKAVFNGLRLAGGQPVYAYPQELAGVGISGPVLPSEIKRCLAEHPDASAVILPSPNYYGICSDIKGIADMVHEAGMVLIVDQAHGAHLKLFDQYAGSWTGDAASGREAGAADGLRTADRKHDSLSGEVDGLRTADRFRAAENQGADVIVESTHKTLASCTQSAIVNLNSDRVDQYVFADKLQMIESTSPSYLLMASLDINADLMEKRGQELTKQWEADLRYFYKEAKMIPGLRVLEHLMLDPTKINLDMSGCGLTGLQLEEQLMERGIFVELVTGDILMCMTGIGNRRCDYDRLLAALREISDEQWSATGHSPCTPCMRPAADLPEQVGLGLQTPLMEKRPSGRQAVMLKKLSQREIPEICERVPVSEAAGRVCGSSIVPYPPGIPIICPGEVMDAEVLAYAAALREAGEKVIGIDEAGFVLAGKEI